MPSGNSSWQASFCCPVSLKQTHTSHSFVVKTVVLYIIGNRRVVRSVTRNCVKCKCVDDKPCPQLLGQLPVDRLNPSPIFWNVVIDYAGSMLIKFGLITETGYYQSIRMHIPFFSVKAVHLELISDLTTAAFIATL